MSSALGMTQKQGPVHGNFLEYEVWTCLVINPGPSLGQGV